MADIATPSAVEMAVGADIAQPADNKLKPEKPEKPDDAAYEKEKAKLDGLIQRQKAKRDELRSKRDAARTGLDETTHARKKELQDEMNKLKEKQAGDKKSRGTQLDKIKAIEGQMRTRISELNNSKTGVQFKSSEEIDRRIKDIESEVDSGKLKLVDEKKKLAEVSNLRRIKKIFPEFDAKQKDIDRLKAQISELKGEMSKSGNKEEDDQYTKIKTELDAIFSQERQGRSDFKSVGDEWRAADQELTTLITKLKALGDDYYSKRREHRAYEAQAVKVRRERERAERDAERQERHRRILQQRVDEASVKAYLDEIRAGTSLLRLLDPESANLEVPKEQSKFAAQAQRTVNEDGFKGARVVKKEEEDYFAPTGGKKGRKAKSQRKEGAEGKALGRFFDPQVTEQFGLVGLAPPSTSEEIAGVVEKVKEKIAFWKGDQDRKTEENIAQAEKELEEELAEAKAGKPRASKATEANGDAKHEEQPTTNGAAEHAPEAKVDAE